MCLSHFNDLPQPIIEYTKTRSSLRDEAGSISLLRVVEGTSQSLILLYQLVVVCSSGKKFSQKGYFSEEQRLIVHIYILPTFERK